ncbi:hypothetical protein ACHAWF_012766 [Thalassiosira exigua]
MNVKLATWVRGQRDAYRDARLSEDRIERLNGIGFQWRVNQKVDWDGKYELLEIYSKQNGNCMVPQKHKELGRWVCEQRSYYKKKVNGKKSNLNEDRIQKLNSINFSWVAAVKSAKK